MSTLLSIFSESSSTSSRNSVHDEELTMNAYEQKQQRQAEPSKASPSSPSQQTSPGGAPTRQPQDNNHNPKPHTPMDIHSSSYTHSHWSELSKSSVSFVQFRLQDQSFPAFCIVAILLAISFSTVLDLVTNTYPLQPYWSHLYIVLVSITIILGSLVFGVQLYVLMNTRDWSTLLSTSSQSTTAAGCCWQKVAAFLTFSIAPSTKKFPEVEAHTAPLHSCLQWLEPMYYLSTNITLAFYSIYLANLVYENPDLTYNPLPKPHHLQHENLTACLIIPTLLLLVMKRVNFRVACMAWTMNVLIHAALILSFHLYDSISLFLLLIPFTFFLLSEYHRQLWSSFQFYQHIQALIEEINQSAEIKKQNEMRHLMGNVAHDLKTPLSSFVSGIEVVAMIAREVQAYLAQPQDQNMISAIHEKINTIIEISESVTNTNIFMMMTINRCIDYSKSAHGVKLVPILETMSLQATIDFSLKCLDNLKHMIGIEVTYDLSGIHDVDERNESMAKLFVETDKTWLQENLLCLLGNALQHSKANTLESSKAKIVVEVSLATEMFGFRSGIVNKRCGATHRSSFTVPSILSKKTSKPKFLVMEVLDCGAGLISEEDLQKVFLEPAQAVRYTGGTGLGLYSLAKRVEALGGDYGATKRRDGKSGCIFWFCIPWQHLESKKAAGLANAEVASNNLAKSPQTVDNTTLSFKYAEYSTSKYEGQLDDLEQQVRPAQSVTNSNTVATTTMTTTLPTINMSNRTVLIVDDSYLILKMTSMTLRKLGYDIITAENGAEACALIQQTFDESQKHIDLILMDFQMPIMDGIEAIKQIRNLESSCGNLRKQLPIIGFSAKSDSDQIEAAYSLGMNAFVAKPLTTQVFQDVVKNILVE